ncbi:MAG: hypothetical protein ABSC18_06690 [Verrucomicrobiota bacterium]|jgi:hypothetical protein
MNRLLVQRQRRVPIFAVSAAHSEFYGGMIGGYALSCIFTNCLMDRMGGGQFEGFPGNAYILQNCTWHGGLAESDPKLHGDSAGRAGTARLTAPFCPIRGWHDEPFVGKRQRSGPLFAVNAAHSEFYGGM